MANETDIDVAEVLDRAADRIEFGGWTTNTYGEWWQDQGGVCALGGVAWATVQIAHLPLTTTAEDVDRVAEHPLYLATQDALARKVDDGRFKHSFTIVSSWNDSQAEDMETVVDTMRKLAKEKRA